MSLTNCAKQAVITVKWCVQCVIQKQVPRNPRYVIDTCVSYYHRLVTILPLIFMTVFYICMCTLNFVCRCNIPVVIMGETGCGKTRLIRYMCELQKRESGGKNLVMLKVENMPQRLKNLSYVFSR